MENKLPEGWEWKKLSDLADFFYGGAFESSYFNEDGKGVKIIRIRNLKQGFTETYYAGEYDESYLVQNSDILIGMDGEFNIVKWTGKPALLNQRVCKLIIKSNDLLPDFAYRSLVKILKDIEDRTAFVTVKHLSAKHLNTIKIPVPPLETQQKIVSILEKAEETKKLRARADELTQKLLQSVFIEMFDGLHANDWSVTTVEEVVHPNKGSMRTGPFGSQLLHSEFVEEGIAVLGIDNAVKNDFEWGKRRFISESKYEELKRYTVYPGDVVITIMGTCGRCAIVPDDIPLSINTKHLCCITLNQEKCLPIYLHGYFLQHPIARHYLLSKANGAIMDGLNMKIIKDMPIIIPPIELQKKYGTIVQKINETKQTQQQSSLEINNLFDVLMQKAFTGELVS